MRLNGHPAGARPDAAASRPTLPTAKALTCLRRRLQAEDGFTIVEVIVATLVLVVGLLTAFFALNVSVHSSSQVREREQAVSLARQVVEDARSIPYSQLSSSDLVSRLQAFPGLANTGSGSTWTVLRPSSNGYTYTLTASLSELTDPTDCTKDPNDPNCTAGTTTTDIKQVTVTVRWNTFQGASHTYTETTLVSRAGQDPGLEASQLQLEPAPTGQWGDAGVQGTQFAPVVTSTGITSLNFQVSAPAGTQAIVWTLNGAKQTAWNGSAPTTGTTWTSSSWSISGLSDGNYTVGAAAVDADGVDGPAITIPVRLIRNVPSAPSVTGYGFNSNFSGGPGGIVAELQWSANPELNVVGYRVYQGSTVTSANLICQTSLTTANSTCGSNAWCTTPTSCVDLSPGSTTTYTVTPLYYDANNDLKDGNGTAVTLASGTPSAPGPPTASTGVSERADDTADVTWVPPVGGTPVSFYRIYRDGTSYTNRYDTISASSCSAVCTYHDVNRSEAHSYYVTAVGGTSPGSDMAESTMLSVGTK